MAMITVLYYFVKFMINSEKRRRAKLGEFSKPISREKLKPGDHIFSWRKGRIYAHHGIYIGDDMVIHFTSAVDQKIGSTGTFWNKLLFSSSPTPTRTICERCGDQTKLHGVIKSCLDCFLAGGKLYVFEYKFSPSYFIKPRNCSLAASGPPEDALHRAKSLLDEGFGEYNLVNNNCEDFAIYCKTGLRNWRQGLGARPVSCLRLPPA